MSIPNNAYVNYVLKAIRKINMEGVPLKRETTKYRLLYEGKYYPPKYVLSIANSFAKDEEFSSYDFSDGDKTNYFLEGLGFTIVRIIEDTPAEKSKTTFFRVPALEPVERSREYFSYEEPIRCFIIYEYLFNSRAHRWLDMNIIGINPKESRGYQSMGVLHYVGIKDKHKGIFSNLSIYKAVNILEQQEYDFDLIIQFLYRYNELVVNEKIHGDVQKELESIIKSKTTIELTDTEKEQIIKSRIGHTTFKKALIHIEKKCKLCGISDERFLVASHIKPWSQSNHQERLDAFNGLLLCPNHDVLFDKGYISFSENGAILISKSLEEDTMVLLDIDETSKINLNKKQQYYMQWHRENLFLK
ncbi:HNH endonuclease [Halobacillus andaensis]|uniref:HNH endonuclease n=1 Tax=Halobacillus andaensis TaxID=1176239 RepID=UPI003D73C397